MDFSNELNSSGKPGRSPAIPRAQSILLSILILILTGIHCACPVPEKTDNPLFAGGPILFLGDSITQDGTYVSCIEYYLDKMYPDETFDIIGIGLSSETVSGLTEKNHPFPRPCLHERLNRALEMIKPRLVIACYGMNDGIYHPPGAGRMKAFQDGILALIRKARGAGAEVVLLTPPPFDPLPVADKLAKDDAGEYGYDKPYFRYDVVLEGYAGWMMDLRMRGVRTVDLNTPMTQYLKQKRLEEHGFCFSPDGVHPSPAGHLFMALEFLNGMGMPIKIKDLDKEWTRVISDSIYSLVDRRRRIRSSGWLDAIRETEAEAAALQREIDRIRRK